MNSWVKSLLAIEASLFAAASTIHAGVVLGGYEHGRAGTAEVAIATVLMTGLAASLVLLKRGRKIALAVQAIALLGTVVGAFTIAIGIGPQNDGGLCVPLLGVVDPHIWADRHFQVEDGVNIRHTHPRSAIELRHLRYAEVAERCDSFRRTATQRRFSSLVTASRTRAGTLWGSSR